MTKQNTPIEPKVADTPVPATAAAPEKFKSANGDVNVPALLKSYLELEKKMSEKAPQNEFGIRPDKPESYQIQIKSELMKNDPEVNQRLFDLGLTQEQAQGIYDLAAEKIVPIIEGLSQTFKADKDLSELQQTFGGAERFNTIARQISAWGEKNLNRDVFESLAGSKDGILTLYQMMRNAQESAVLPRSDRAEVPETADSLKRLMQSPKYWKEQDPELVKRVEDGFKRLYG